MSRLRELIAELCPDGVEYVTLDESCFYPRERMSSDGLDEGTYVSVENLAQDFGGLTGEIATTKPGTPVISFHEGDVLVGNIRPYLKKVWLADFDGGTNGDVLVFRIKDSYGERLLPEFVYVQLASESFIDFDMRYAKGAKMPRGDKKAVLRYRIPVPPLEVQREIVRVLDEYTAAHDELVRKLEEEMALREQQLSLVRNQLLTFSERERVKRMALCVVLVSLAKGTLARGQLLSDGLYPVMNSGRDFYGWYDSKNNSGNAITIAARGEYAGYVNYIERDFWAGGLCYPYRSANEDFALTKYVYHVLKNDEQHMMDSLVARGSIPALNKKDLEKLRIPVPPLEVQRRIVRVLDEYTAAHDELVRKLEEEMALREQQLSLVRNQLLTFTEKAA